MLCWRRSRGSVNPCVSFGWLDSHLFLSAPGYLEFERCEGELMMTVLGCIVDEHNIWLVLVAGLLCGAGSWVTARLFLRATTTSGAQRIGWHVLTAIGMASKPLLQWQPG